MKMTKDFNLYKLIQQAVEQQLTDDDPPETRQALERLVKNGRDRESSKELIAGVIAEEIYRAMEEDRCFDPKVYKEMLSRLD